MFSAVFACSVYKQSRHPNLTFYKLFDVVSVGENIQIINQRFPSFKFVMKLIVR